MEHNRFSIELLRPFWLPFLHKIEGIQGNGLKSWINDGVYTFQSNPTNFCIHLNVNDESKLVNAFAADIARMATACFESIHGIRGTPEFPRSTAWALIRLYYAAFFAAHAIMRINGISCSHFEKGHIHILKTYANAWGNLWTGSGINGGFFVCHYKSNSKTLLFSKKSDTHADTWKEFCKHLRDLSTSILKGRGLSSQRNTVCSFLIMLGDSLENHGRSQGGNWLSQFRNRLNYQQEYGAWYPYGNAQIKFEFIERQLKNWKRDLSFIHLSSSRTKEVERFTELCVAVVALCYALLKDIWTVSPSKRSIFKYHSLAFLRFAKME